MATSRPSTPFTGGIRTLTLILRFLCELALLAALAYGGFRLADGVGAWLLGIGAPLLAGVIWGAFIAPRAPRRAPGIARVALELALFGVAVAVLVATDHPVLAVVLGVAAAATSVLNEVQERTVGLPTGRG